MQKWINVIVLFFAMLPNISAQQVLISSVFTADPSARVMNDTLFVFCSHDKDTAKWFDMTDWYLFTTTDMMHWEDKGVVYELDSVSWATKWAWAPDAVEYAGKYYLFFPTDKKYIGVAVANAPDGPYQDILNLPLITDTTPGVKVTRGLIDPAVFIDKDSTPYLLFGQNDAHIVKLNKDMMSFSDSIRKIVGVKYFFEAIWLHYYNGKYYLSYSGKPKLALRAKIHYAVADHPYGPYQHQGIILGKQKSGTNHASIVEYKGKWYVFYHNAALFYQKNPSAGRWTRKKWYRRSVTFAPLKYDESGRILKVKD